VREAEGVPLPLIFITLAEEFGYANLAQFSETEIPALMTGPFRKVIVLQKRKRYSPPIGPLKANVLAICHKAWFTSKRSLFYESAEAKTEPHEETRRSLGREKTADFSPGGFGGSAAGFLRAARIDSAARWLWISNRLLGQIVQSR
jgi:hypothetical protein